MLARLEDLSVRLRPILGPLLVLALALCAAGRAAWLAAPRSDGAAEALRPLSDGWTYHWGASPRTGEGRWLWSVTDGDTAGWQPYRMGAYPVVDDPARRELWQRLRLPATGREGAETSLLVPAVWQVFDTYLDGKLIYHFGEVDPDGTPHFPGQAWHLVPLGRDWHGKLLTFDVHSDDAYFGVYRPPVLGSERELLTSMLADDAPWLLLGGLYFALGVLGTGILLRFRQDRTYLAFAVYVLFVGIYDMSHANLRQLVVDWPLLWDCVDLLSVFVIPIPILYFFELVFGSGPFRMFRIFRYAQTAFVVSALASIAWRVQAPWPFLTPFQLLFLVEASAMIASAAAKATSTRTFESTVFSLGYAAAAGSGIHDVLASMGVIPVHAYVNHLGVACLITALAVLTTRRFVRAYEAQRGLELARDIQGLLLPKQLQGEFEGWHYQGYCTPHSEVSGDWVQFWSVDAGETRLMFGDVTGKGPQAAIAMAAVSAVIDRCRRHGTALDACLTDIHESLRDLFGGGVGTTVAAASLRANGEVEVYNAGGLGWFHLTGGKVQHLRLAADPLGLTDLSGPARATLQLAPGDSLFSFTDGILDGSRAIADLRKALVGVTEMGAGALYELATEMGRGRVLDDDKTMLVIHRPVAASLAAAS